MPNASEILNFSEDFSLYFTMTIFVIGNIGNLINLCVFTTLKLFRSNQCAFYLIVEAIVNTFQLTILFVIYLLPIIYEYDPGSTSIAWCKIKSVIPQIFRLLSTSMVCFAALDQFLSTNPQGSIRQISTLKLAYRLTFVAICLWLIHSIPYAIFYQIILPNGCIITNTGITQYYAYFYYPVLHGFLPIFASSLFSILAYRNVRHLIRRQMNVGRRRLDRQLTAMIFARVICFVLFLFPYTVYRIYSLNATISRANLYAYAIDRLIFSIMSSLTNLNYTMSFYIFVVSSSRYRRQVKHFFVKKCWQNLKIICCIKQNEIHPSRRISNAVPTDDE